MKRVMRVMRSLLTTTRWEQAASGAHPMASRTGWPPLSTTPSTTRRMGNAPPWRPKGPRDDWKR